MNRGLDSASASISASPEPLPAPRRGYLERTARLLADIFGAHRFSPAYLDWQYERSPEGREIATDLADERGQPLAHYAVVPQTWVSPADRRRFALSLHTAVRPEARGRGTFTRLAEATYELARRDHGVTAVIGVANANSTPGFVRRLGFALHESLPVIVGMAMPRASAETSSYASGEVDAGLWESLDLAPTSGWVQEWTAEKIAWRLASPRGPYGVHVHGSGVMVTAPARRGVPIIVVLKIFRRRGASEVATQPLLRAACRYHRTAVYLYGGYNGRARIGGWPLPRRLRPAPLNLIYRALDASVPASSDMRFETFEFLDFDAY